MEEYGKRILNIVVLFTLLIIGLFTSSVRADTYVFPEDVTLQVFKTLPIRYYGNPGGNFCGVLLFANWGCDYCRYFAKKIMQAIDEGENIVLYLYLDHSDDEDILDKTASFICSKEGMEYFVDSAVSEAPEADEVCKEEIKNRLFLIGDWFDDNVLDRFVGDDFDLTHYPMVLLNDGSFYTQDTITPEMIIEKCKEVTGEQAEHS